MGCHQAAKVEAEVKAEVEVEALSTCGDAVSSGVVKSGWMGHRQAVEVEAPSAHISCEGGQTGHRQAVEADAEGGGCRGRRMQRCQVCR